MVRVSTIATAALMAATASAAALPELVSRQNRVIAAPRDLLGLYSLVTDIGSCPKSIQHIGTVNGAVMHKDIKQGQTRCNDDGKMVLTPGSDQNAINEVINSLSSFPDGQDLIKNGISSSAEDVYVGVETEGRNCGETSLAKGTVVIFAQPGDTAITLGPGVSFPGSAQNGDKRYMVVASPDTPGTCFYSASVRESPAPKPVTPAVVPSGGSGTPASESPAPEDADASPAPGDTDAPLVLPNPGSAGTDGTTDGTTDSGADTDDDADATSSPEEDDGDDDGSVCFNDAATVQLEDGSVKRMDAVQLGDRVKVSSGEFSDVFMFTHKSANVVNKFVKLTTAAGPQLTLTSGHFLYVNGALSAAKTVKSGDSLELGNGDCTVVESVETISAKGLYNPQTIHGDIIVNNVRASTYTTTIEPAVAHALLTPFRSVFRSLGFSTKVLDNGMDVLAKTAL